MSHPEILPTVDPLTHFWCSTSSAQEAQKEIEAKRDKLRERIDNISEKVTFAHTPFGSLQIIDQLLGLSKDETELDLLGRALQRIAPLVKELKSLDERYKVVSTIAQDPAWFASVFGDFSHSFDDIDNSIQNTAE